MGIVLGGENARFQRVHGDVVASYQYVNGERAMVLWPRYRKGVPAYIVCDSAAFKYDDPKYLAQQAKVACELWGMETSTVNWYKVAKIIHDGLGDLVRLPPLMAQPGGEGPAIGEASLILGGKEVMAREVNMPTLDELARYEGTKH